MLSFFSSYHSIFEHIQFFVHFLTIKLYFHVYYNVKNEIPEMHLICLLLLKKNIFLKTQLPVLVLFFFIFLFYVCFIFVICFLLKKVFVK